MRFRYFLFALKRAFQLTGATFAGLLRQKSFTRLLLVLLLLPLLFLLQAANWIGFLCDELFFSGYRRVQVKAPLFIIGAPRSGTTFLQRVLSGDSQLTTLSTWECLLAPSISQRKLALLGAALDRRLGHPLAGMRRVLEKRLQERFDTVHVLRLEMPEEDYLTLLPLFSCFLLVLAFPDDEFLWRLGWFENRLSDTEKSCVLGFYQVMLQKHLYTHGPAKTLLAKNPSFCSWIPALRQWFPDCLIIVPLRDPLKTYQSQLSAVAGGLRLLQLQPRAPWFGQRFLALYTQAYQVLFEQIGAEHADSILAIPMAQLKKDLSASVADLYQQLGLQLSAAFAANLAEEARSAAAYQSAHRYDLNDFRIDPASVQHALGAARQECQRRWERGQTSADRNMNSEKVAKAC